jgi:hypothetical protein
MIRYMIHREILRSVKVIKEVYSFYSKCELIVAYPRGHFGVFSPET